MSTLGGGTDLRVRDVLGALLDGDRLHAAFAHVVANDGAPGVDGVSASAFAEGIADRLAELASGVRDGGYRPSALLALRIPKDKDPRGRELLVPTVADRVLHRAVHDVLAPAVDARLLPCVHGFRPGRSVQGAVAAVRAAVADRPWVADADIADFFASLPHATVLDQLRAWVDDEGLVELVGRWLAVPALRAGRLEPRPCGLPLGSPLSPLLANVVLHPLDVGLWRPDTTYVRFADDLVVCCAEEAGARQQLHACAGVLADLGLKLNEAKSRVLDARGESVVFLGHLVRAGGAEAVLERPRRRSLHLVEPGSRLTVRGQRHVVQRDGIDLLSVPIGRVREIVVLAPGDLGSAAVIACLQRGIDISWMSEHGRWWGSLRTWASEAPDLRRVQALATLDPARCLVLGRSMIAAKVHNQKRLLQRHRARAGAATPSLDRALSELGDADVALHAAADRAALMGAEGWASRAFFSGLAALVDPALGFGGRVRRPPTDPVNALLSFGYVLLTNEVQTACWRVGLDAHLGVLHQPRSGRPSLALDLVEELRTLIDSLVIGVPRRRVLRAEHFQRDPATGGVRLSGDGRKVYLREYELRLLTLFTHDPTGERVSYRRAAVLQAEQLARVLRHPGLTYLPVRLT